jgi:transcriptional regulator with XRE-family HTH domain
MHDAGMSAAPRDDGQGEDGQAARTALIDNGYWVGRLGQMLKERRDGRFTVEELAARAGVSAGLISQIERGIGNPSLATLTRLSRALGLPISAMFEGQQFGEDEMLVRRAERRRLEVPSDGITHEMLVPNTNRKLGMIQTTIPAGHSGDELPYSHAGEEIVLVLSGRVTASVGGQVFELDEGDALSYDAALPHSWSNPHDEPAVVLFASTPPGSASH